MAWFQVDDQLAFHPKVIQAGNAAMGMWVRAGAWSQAHLTGGHIPAEQVKALGGVAVAKKLVAAGLWIVDDERGGYRFHEWGSRQMSAEEIMERRAKRSASGRKGGVVSAANRRAKREANGEASALRGASAFSSESDEKNRSARDGESDRRDTSDSGLKPDLPGRISKTGQANAQAHASTNARQVLKQNPTPAPVPTKEPSNEGPFALSLSSPNSPPAEQLETEREHPGVSMILIPDDWRPNDLHRAKFPRPDLPDLADGFRDHAIATGRRCRGRGGWDAAFSNWVRKSPPAAMPGVGAASTKAAGWLDIANAAAQQPNDQRAIR